MILGVGVDIVEVARLQSWTSFSYERLRKIFSEQELRDALAADGVYYRSDKLAARFAAKEAFFKALSASLVSLNFTSKTFSFMYACQYSEVVKSVWDVPTLHIQWKKFEEKIDHQLPHLNVHLSLADEQHYVTAFVVISSS